eukprot:GILI01005108.1.p1 GENE.GILI01005108.1~~GILI01005108.1.p1  ORF type:complete len:636 (+),score=181.78 GILI01005108.1:101-2008(+)
MPPNSRSYLLFLALFAFSSFAFADSSVSNDDELVPILLVPGVGGSVLNFEDSQGGVSRAWINLYYQETKVKDYLWGFFNEETWTLEPFDNSSRVYSPDTGFGLDSIRNLDPSLFWPIASLTTYFDRLIFNLVKRGYVPGQTLFGMPYDWRQTNNGKNSARFVEFAQNISQKTGKRISVISHSMGGLVVRDAMIRFPAQFEASVSRWAAVAAPFQGGAGKILSEFLSGYNLGNPLVKPETARQLAISTPTVYELLPNPVFPWVYRPFVKANINGSEKVYYASSRIHDEHSVYDLFVGALQDNTISTGKDVRPLPFNEILLAVTNEVQQQWVQAVLPTSIEFLNLYSLGLETPVGVTFSGAHNHPKDLLTAKFSFNLGDGDYTVPCESAAQDGFETTNFNVMREHVQCPHMDCIFDPVVLEYITCFLKLPQCNPSYTVKLAESKARYAWSRKSDPSSRDFFVTENDCKPPSFVPKSATNSATNSATSQPHPDLKRGAEIDPVEESRLVEEIVTLGSQVGDPKLLDAILLDELSRFQTHVFGGQVQRKTLRSPQEVQTLFGIDDEEQMKKVERIRQAFRKKLIMRQQALGHTSLLQSKLAKERTPTAEDEEFEKYMTEYSSLDHMLKEAAKSGSAPAI